MTNEVSKEFCVGYENPIEIKESSVNFKISMTF
jgi:hypothetical protein